MAVVHAFQPMAVPLVRHGDGTLRVEGTRVLLEMIVAAFRGGATPEEIAHQYPPVALEAVYAIVAWLLHNTEETNAYLAQRAAAADEVRATCEKAYSPDGIRARLLARRGSS